MIIVIIIRDSSIQKIFMIIEWGGYVCIAGIATVRFVDAVALVDGLPVQLVDVDAV